MATTFEIVGSAPVVAGVSVTLAAVSALVLLSEASDTTLWIALVAATIVILVRLARITRAELDT